MAPWTSRLCACTSGVPSLLLLGLLSGSAGPAWLGPLCLGVGVPGVSPFEPWVCWVCALSRGLGGGGGWSLLGRPGWPWGLGWVGPPVAPLSLPALLPSSSLLSCLAARPRPSPSPGGAGGPPLPGGLAWGPGGLSGGVALAHPGTGLGTCLCAATGDKFLLAGGFCPGPVLSLGVVGWVGSRWCCGVGALHPGRAGSGAGVGAHGPCFLVVRPGPPSGAGCCMRLARGGATASAGALV